MTNVEKVRKLLKENGQMLTWWVKKYTPEQKYEGIYKQFTGVNVPTNETKKAMRKYLREWRK